MEQHELGGVVVPVITPVDGEDRVDEAAFRGVIRRLIGAGVHAIFAGGSAGEGPLLTDREWARMVTIAAEEVKGETHLLGGAIDTSARRVLARLAILRDLGYPYCVVTPTYYITLRARNEYLRLFETCAEQAGPMQIIAYNIPSCTGSVIPAGAMLEMAQRGWFRYCKESSGDWAYFERLVTEGAGLGLRVLQGEEAHIARGLLAGAAGIVPVCANYEPRTFVAAYEAAGAQDEAALARLQERILELRQSLLFVGDLWIAGIKYALASLGYGSGLPVAPLEPLNAEQRGRIDRFVHETEGAAAWR